MTWIAVAQIGSLKTWKRSSCSWQFPKLLSSLPLTSGSYGMQSHAAMKCHTYVTLLFCQLALKEEGQFEQVHRYCTEQRAKNLYLAVDAGVVQAALKSNLPDELHQRLRWTSAITPALTEGVKGNPRQVKRLLNALLLRRPLAEVAKLDIRDDVLVKLMLLEYTRPELFDQLYIWQALAEGHPAQLRQLEETAQAANNPDSSVGQQQTLSIPGMKAGWQEKPVQDWLRLALYWLLGTSVQKKTDLASSITLIPCHGTRLRDRGTGSSRWM